MMPGDGTVVIIHRASLHNDDDMETRTVEMVMIEETATKLEQ